MPSGNPEHQIGVLAACAFATVLSGDPSGRPTWRSAAPSDRSTLIERPAFRPAGGPTRWPG